MFASRLVEHRSQAVFAFIVFSITVKTLAQECDIYFEGNTMRLFESEQLKQLLKLHEAMDEAPRRPGCLDTDPEVFFADRAGESYADARKICRECPVIAQCAEYAIKWEPEGYWGGLAPRDRLRLNWALKRAERAA